MFTKKQDIYEIAITDGEETYYTSVSKEVYEQLEIGCHYKEE